jgi:hypothetical protein
MKHLEIKSTKQVPAKYATRAAVQESLPITKIIDEVKIELK